MTTSLPLILTGPTLRHCDTKHFTLSFVSREPLSELVLTLEDKTYTFNEVHKKAEEPSGQRISAQDDSQTCELVYLALGARAHYYQLHLELAGLLTENIPLHYRLDSQQHSDMFASLDELSYSHDGQTLAPHVIIKTNIEQMLHGSCRNPHHHSDDALKAADSHLSQDLSPQARPSLLMLSGDQIYVDDVAGPMLYAIDQVIILLGLSHEAFEGAAISTSQDISYQPSKLYQRHKNLLPRTQYPAKTALWHWYRNHPIFTSSLAENHLVSLGEVIALYLLTWSPALWQCIDIPEQPEGMTPANTLRWQKQAQHLQAFVAGLKQVRRLLAHLPTYMMFDDHDVTDDWNLTARWEEGAYGHAFSKRIIGNALIGYALFQGLGNNPKVFRADIIPKLQELFAGAAKHQDKFVLLSEPQDTLIDTLLKFELWHYSLNTSPKVVVLDTRTRRWRSESNLAKPSGLMDWEALMDLQQELIGQHKVIIVSPAPIFGVKLIETVQRSATLLGGSLLVDAENWMAHPGAANALLSIFMHRKTPEQFVILSGDVHYSFAYDIRIRFRHGSPHIYQITCSGIKNHFPEKLLPWFDKLNGWLYGYFSPLNLFTKRKRMLIRGRRPNGHSSQRLVNRSGLGILKLDDKGAPSQISVLHSDLSQTIFEPPRDETPKDER
jgi:hypothetical protein